MALPLAVITPAWFRGFAVCPALKDAYHVIR